MSTRIRGVGEEMEGRAVIVMDIKDARFLAGYLASCYASVTYSRAQTLLAELIGDLEGAEGWRRDP